MSAQAHNQVPAAGRVLDLLEALAAAPDGLTSAELSQVMSGSRSTLYSLLNTLRTRDYVVQDDTRGRYRIGPAAWGLVPDRTDAMTTLVDAFEQLYEEPPSETTALVTRAGDRYPIIAEAPSDHQVRSVYATAHTHVPQGAAALVLRAGGANSDQQLVTVRENGYALVETEEMVEIALPVCRDGVQPVAALVMGVPMQRAGAVSTSTLVTELRTHAMQLSYRLGARLYTPFGISDLFQVGPRRILEESEVAELLEGPWGIQLACVRHDGTPHLVPLWYEWDLASVWVTATPGASWQQYVASNDMVSLTLDEPWPPLRRVFVRGRAVAVADDEVPGGVIGLRRRLAQRYVGTSDVADPDEPGWQAYRIEPTHLHGVEGLGTPTSRATAV